jgi:serine/threonine protein kinase/Flp pilus assembly protein TadD
MTHTSDISRSTEQPVEQASRAALSADVQAILAKWPAGARFDAAEILARKPELSQHRSIVVALALEDFIRRCEAQEPVDPRLFAARFPRFAAEVLEQLNVFQEMESNLDLVGDLVVEEVQHQAAPLSAEPPSRPPIRWPEVGRRFLQFELLEELGRGSFARAYLARDLSLGGRLSVLKVGEGGGTEAATHGRLEHPHIVPVNSVRTDLDTGLTAMCMPYLGRATLAAVVDFADFAESPPATGRAVADIVARLNVDVDDGELGFAAEQLPLFAGSYVDTVLRIAAQIAGALSYTHGNGIFHRDIKPSNVLLAADGRAMLFDFNLAFRQARSENTIAGTFSYMAPEQLVGFRERIFAGAAGDARTDLFSLGAMLYQLLGGRLPFPTLPPGTGDRRVVDDLLAKHHAGPVPLRELNPAVDAKLARLVERCLSIDPEDRPQSAAELAELLVAHLAVRRRIARWAATHRRAAAGLAASGLALCLAVAAVFAQQPPYSLRQLQSGWTAQEAREHWPAVQHFTRALEGDPQLSEALFARGRSYLQLGEYDLAFQDFRCLGPAGEDSPQVAACMAHCLANLDHRYQAAIEYYRKAIDLGLASPGVLNNLGHCYQELGDLESAKSFLLKAVEQDDRLQVAHHNLARINFREAVAGRDALNVRHVERALTLGPGHALLHLDAACIFALAHRLGVTPPAGGNGEPDFAQRALAHCEQAVRLGIEHKRLEAAAAQFGALKSNPRFLRLLAARPAPNRPDVSHAASPPWFVDPLVGSHQPFADAAATLVKATNH